MRRTNAAILALLMTGCGKAYRTPVLPKAPAPSLSAPVTPTLTGRWQTPTDDQPVTAAATLKVLTYNTWGKPGILGKEEKQRFERLPKALAPYDLVFLQETFTRHTAGLLAGFPHHQRETKRGFKVINSGLTILSRFEIVETDFKSFSDCSHWDCLANKGVSFVRLNVPNVGPVDVYNTHLQAEDSNAARHVRLTDNLPALEQLYRAHDQGNPTLIAGDFNSRPDSPEITALKDRLPVRDLYHELHPDKPGYTWDPARNMNLKPGGEQARIDYIFAIGDRIRPLSAEVVMDQPVDGFTLSDHLGVAVELEILAD